MIFLIIALIILIEIFIYSTIKFCIHKNKFDEEYNNWWRERMEFQRNLNKKN
jgi:hypothetical protein